MEVRIISDTYQLDELIQNLKNDGNQIQSSDLIDQVISMQLTKINNNHIGNVEFIEVATSNLIELLKMREKYR